MAAKTAGSLSPSEEFTADQLSSCRAAARRIGPLIPAPFDIRKLCARLGRSLGRDIRLMPESDFAGQPSGLLISTAEADIVCYAGRTTPLHQAHIALHEISHLVLGHCSAGDIESLARLLLPGTDARLIRHILGRQGYAAPEERAAELTASMLLERACRSAVAVHGYCAEPPEGRCPPRARCPARVPCPAPSGGPSSLTWVTLSSFSDMTDPSWCRNAYQELGPLWAALSQAVPQVILPLPAGVRHQAGLALYRRAVEIRDAALILGAPVPDGTRVIVARREHEPDLAAQAAALAEAIRSRRVREARCRDEPAQVVPARMQPDLYSEVTHLVQLSRAFRELAR